MNLPQRTFVPGVAGSAAAGLMLLAGAFSAAGQSRGVPGATDPAPGTVFSDCDICPRVVVVPAGTFTMGSAASEQGRGDDEGPQHSVTISAPFAVGVYEMTFAEWDACARARGCGGYANRDDDDVSCSDGYEYTAPVGSFAPNAFGLYDVLGNVYEWTQDCWNGSYAGAPADGSAWQSGDCGRRVLRGGSWGFSWNNLRSANRSRDISDDRGNSVVGLRVARRLN
ncbi:formylglycine-generating enzyme family protein [Candidatus Palauibacter sp.]|uniref:formylglycine-generating enzyme family protein n=1 Tax=Candidatus Palauibacter sp. TaxID=3101350 RepID=UPI003B02A245